MDKHRKAGDVPGFLYCTGLKSVINYKITCAIYAHVQKEAAFSIGLQITHSYFSSDQYVLILRMGQY